MPDNACCPVAAVGQSDGMYYYGCVCCPSGTACDCNDTRPHQLGTGCADCPDPVPIQHPGGGGGLRLANPAGDNPGHEYHCGCSEAGIPDYVTLRTPFKPGKKAKVVARGTAWYRDGRRTRKVRWFVVESGVPGPAPRIHRVALELSPRTPLPADGAFEATLDHRDGHYHRIRLKGLGDVAFHVVVKKRGRAAGKSAARGRAKAG